MRNRNQKPTRYAMDGFIPRQPQRASGPRRRASLSQPTPHGQSPKAHVRHDARESFAFDDDTKAVGSLKQPIDLGMGPKEPKKPHFWQFKKRREYKRMQRAKWSRRKRITRRVLKIIGVVLVLIALFLGIKFLINAGRIFDGNILGLFNKTRLRGEDEGRVNILLAGTSEDSVGHDGADLTDSIMLVSLDTEKNKAFTVSIPRDLWVEYGRACSSGYEGKINVVYQCGEQTKFRETGYAPGGMGMLQKVVGEAFDMPIHYYGKISYDAFRDAVNAVGGITITIDSDDPRGIYDPNFQRHEGGPLRLNNGKHVINGVTALRLARSRNSAGGYGMSRGDFDRTMYQQKMLVSLKNKALSIGVLANPAKISELLDTAGKHVKTDFKTNELRRLYELAGLIESRNIRSIDLSSDDINLLTTGMYGGQSIVLPVAGIKDFSQIQTYFKRITSTNPAIQEGATVAILNGSGITGAAQKKADVLIQKGVAVPVVANASTAQSASVVIDLSRNTKPATKKMLEQQFGVKAARNTAAYPDARLYEADFVVIVGKSGANSIAVR